MIEDLKLAQKALEKFAAGRIAGRTDHVDRPEVVSHALLSGLDHHWPSRSTLGIKALLEKTSEVKETEHSRWMTQRRIAIAKLARFFNT